MIWWVGKLRQRRALYWVQVFENLNQHFSFGFGEDLYQRGEFLSYIKVNDDKSNIIWCIANFDANYVQKGQVKISREVLNITGRVNLKLTNLLTGKVLHWFNDWNFIEINPEELPVQVFSVEVVRPKFSDMPMEEE